MRARLHPLRRPPVLAGALLATLLAAAPADASGGRIAEPARGRTLVSGEIVEIRWTPFDVPVDELEILLTVDDTGQFPLRLTSRLDPRSGAFVWRVPDLPTTSARLAIRFGHGGRESAGPTSAPFAIVTASGRRLEPVGIGGGEGWGRGLPRAPAGPAGARPVPHWSAGLRAVVAAVLSSVAGPPEPAGSTRAVPVLLSPAHGWASDPLLGQTTRAGFVPQRE